MPFKVVVQVVGPNPVDIPLAPLAALFVVLCTAYMDDFSLLELLKRIAIPIFVPPPATVAKVALV